jgi:hypothetical protein
LKGRTGRAIDAVPACPLRRGLHVDQCNRFFRRRSDGNPVERRDVVLVDVGNIIHIVDVSDLVDLIDIVDLVLAVGRRKLGLRGQWRLVQDGCQRGLHHR